MYKIETFMDFTCPFSYIGFYILERLKKEENIEHTWYSYLLNPDAPKEGVKVDQTFSEEQKNKALERLELLGSDYNLEFNSGDFGESVLTVNAECNAKNLKDIIEVLSEYQRLKSLELI